MDIIVQYYQICAIANPVKLPGKLNPKFYVVRGDSSYPKESVIGGKQDITEANNTEVVVFTGTKKIMVI